MRGYIPSRWQTSCPFSAVLNPNDFLFRPRYYCPVVCKTIQSGQVPDFFWLRGDRIFTKNLLADMPAREHQSLGDVGWLTKLIAPYESGGYGRRSQKLMISYSLMGPAVTTISLNANSSRYARPLGWRGLIGMACGISPYRAGSRLGSHQRLADVCWSRITASHDGSLRPSISHSKAVDAIAKGLLRRTLGERSCAIQRRPRHMTCRGGAVQH